MRCLAQQQTAWFYGINCGHKTICTFFKMPVDFVAEV